MKKEEKSTPILLSNTEWIPPEKLLNEVKSERMINGLCNLAKPELKEKTVGDAEALAYMMPHTGRVPLSGHWIDIYLYLATQISKRWKTYDALPKECRLEKLNDYEMQELNDLKSRIYEKRGGEEVNPVLLALKEVFLTKPL